MQIPQRPAQAGSVRKLVSVLNLPKAGLLSNSKDHSATYTMR